MAKNERSLAGGGGRGKAMGDLRTRFKVDIAQLDKLVAGVSQIRKDFEALDKALPKINSKLNTTLRALQGIQRTGGNGTGAQNPTAAGVNLPLGSPSTSGNVYNILNQTVQASPGGGGGDGGGAVSAGGRGGAVAGKALQYLTVGIQALDDRISNNYMRSLSVDKLAVYYQQQKGISQMQYMEQMRDPIRGARLGYGGINTLLSLQASTGINAQQQAAGVAGLRAVSGYSYDTGQMAQMLGTMGSAAVNNRMTMMMGTGLFGLGGQQRSMDQVIKQIVQRTGLTNEKRLAGARQLGSNTRAMLEASGVPPDMIDMVLDYAQANVSYQQKTGSKRMYDPTKAKDRTIMGIEDNFATQAEETARTREARDEQFYKRQADNYAQMEKNLQAVTEALGRFEDKLSGIVGTGVSTKGSIARKVLGGALMVGGAALAPFTAGGGVALAGVGATLLAGDPPEKATGRPNITKVPMGYSSPAKRVTLGEMANHPNFAPMNAKFRDRLLRMFAANPNVGLGQGMRSESQQETMFHQRYRPVQGNEKPDLAWDGIGWKHVSGVPAAPPGRSMHEIGLAADLVGDLDWVQKHAHEFGLKTFGKNMNEPWHVQPAELPDSRYEYEKQGSPWGQPAGTRRDSAKVQVDGRGRPYGGAVVGDKVLGSPGQLGSSYETFAQQSISQILGESFSATVARMDGVGESAVGRRVASGGSAGTTPSKTTVANGAMDPYDLARLLYKKGFRGNDITNMLAISYRESRWTPGVLADDEDDKSYGLFQINMKGNLGPARRKYFKISRDEELYDPEVNVRAARILFGGGNYSPWNIDGNPMARTETILPKAQAITKELGYTGDPMMNEPTRATTVQVSGGTNVTIAPTINVVSSGNNVNDARRMAQEIARIMETELKREALRSV